MKKPLVMSLLLLCSTYSFAQQAHEFGLMFSNLDSYGIIYKTGKKEALTRFSFLSASSSNNETTDGFGNTTKTKASGFGLAIGREYRKQLSEKFRIVFGPEVGYTFQKSKTDTNLSSETKTNIWSIDAILGVNYTFSDNFLISVELSPGVMFGKSKNEFEDVDGTIRERNTDITSFQFGSASASITLAYRLFKDKTE